MNKGTWYAASLLVGVAVHLPLDLHNTGRLAFTGKATLGAARLTMPTLAAYGVNDSIAAATQQSGTSAFGLSFLLSAGIEYRLTKRLWLEANANYFGTAQISFKNVREAIGFQEQSANAGLQPTGSAYVDYYTATQKQTVGSFNINMGIAIRL